jgi:threonine dehydrogenase-like Zn-dependent dehydrogenase
MKAFIDAVMNFWYNMVDAVETATTVLVIGCGMAGIFTVVFFRFLSYEK